MANDPSSKSHRSVPYTAAMAGLYAEQGYWRKAAEIYRCLIAEFPERVELRRALQRLESRQAERRAPTRKDIELLLREWAAMLKNQIKHPTRGRKP